MLRSIFIVAVMLGVSATARADDEQSRVARGAKLYSTYCALCHGPTGQGDGRAAHVQRVKPADLTASQRSDEYKRDIIANGGASMNRSSSMPPWRDMLGAQDVDDLIAYLRELMGTQSNVTATVSNSAPGTQR